MTIYTPEVAANIEALHQVSQDGLTTWVQSQAERQESFDQLVDRYLENPDGQPPETVRNYLAMTLAVAVERLAALQREKK